MRQLSELADLVNGELNRSFSFAISGAASIACAGNEDITFVTTSKFLAEFEASSAAAAVVPVGMVSKTKPCIEVADPENAFEKIVSLFRAPVERQPVGVSPQAIVAPTAQIAENVNIYPGAVVMDNVEIGCGTVIFPNVTIMENCRLGSNVKVFPGAVIYENTEIGDRCLIHAGVVLGAYGFGYESSSGTHQLCPQLGNVKIESDVEIGANSTIDRGTYDTTTIGQGTKIDNLVMVGHNCQIGKHNIYCSQVGIAGSCSTGDYVVMGGQVGMADHLNIGSKTTIAARSGLMNDVPAGEKYFGAPARPMREEMQMLASRAKLPEMRKTLRRLERQVEQLNNNKTEEPDSRAA